MKAQTDADFHNDQNSRILRSKNERERERERERENEREKKKRDGTSYNQNVCNNRALAFLYSMLLSFIFHIED